MRSSVAIPVEDLTREQLIKELHRLDGRLADYERKTDQEVRRENERLRTELYKVDGQLESICTTLCYWDLGKYTYHDAELMKKHGGKGLISAGVQRLAYMSDEERREIRERRRSEAAESDRREKERKGSSASSDTVLPATAAREG